MVIDLIFSFYFCSFYSHCLNSDLSLWNQLSFFWPTLLSSSQTPALLWGWGVVLGWPLSQSSTAVGLLRNGYNWPKFRRPERLVGNFFPKYFLSWNCMNRYSVCLLSLSLSFMIFFIKIIFFCEDTAQPPPPLPVAWVILFWHRMPWGNGLGLEEHALPWRPGCVDTEDKARVWLCTSLCQHVF